jgi:hypothetical protein
VTFTPAWIYCQAPLAQSADEPLWQWYETLLHVTDHIYMAKCALASDGQVLLQTELPARQFTSLQFAEMLTAMKIYRDQYGDGFEAASRQLPILEIAAILGRGTQEPSSLPVSQIEVFFGQMRKEGWHLSPEPMDDSWLATYDGQHRRHPVYVTFTGDWVYFQSSLARYARRAATRKALSTYLLELNSHLYWAKLSTQRARTEKGEVVENVVLAVEAPANGFNITTFQEAARTLATYLERCYFEVNLMAIEDELSPLVMGEAPDPAWFEPPPKRVVFTN